MNIYDVALRHLSSRSRTVAETESYLLKKGFSEEETKVLIEEFKSCGYLDDSRYCREYFDYGFGKGKGKRRVLEELRRQGVDPQVIEIAFEDYEPEDSETERARRETERVLRLAGIDGGDPVPEKVRGRVARRLQAKGYSSDIIYSIIGELKR
ncbi:MAG: regulatory protein RecX [Anaerovoracaceae bacterium]